MIDLLSLNDLLNIFVAMLGGYFLYLVMNKGFGNNFETIMFTIMLIMGILLFLIVENDKIETNQNQNTSIEKS